jgi:hypothetical protein
MLRWQKMWIRSRLGGMCNGFICFSIVLYLSIYLPLYPHTHFPVNLPTDFAYLPTGLSTHPCIVTYREKHFSTHQELPETRENPLCVPSNKKSWCFQAAFDSTTTYFMF